MGLLLPGMLLVAHLTVVLSVPRPLPHGGWPFSPIASLCNFLGVGCSIDCMHFNNHLTETLGPYSLHTFSDTYFRIGHSLSHSTPLATPLLIALPRHSALQATPITLFLNTT